MGLPHDELLARSELTFTQHIDESMKAMNAMRRLLHGRDLNDLDKAETVFLEAFKSVKKHIETYGIVRASEKELAYLRQLEVMHHKVLRLMMDKMHNLEEDIQVIEGAQAHLRKAAEVIL